jgi:MtfA peptidase
VVFDQLWRRKPVASPEQWAQAAAQLPLLHGLDAEARTRLFSLGETFLRSKSIEPVAGLELALPMRLKLALQACLPVLNLGLEYYRNWYAVVVYPAGFIVKHEYVDEAGAVHVMHGELAGEAWERGPVILSWEDIEEGELDGYNVVIHEFAHKLDILEGGINGLPPLHAGMPAKEWSRVFSDAYEDMCTRAEAGEEQSLDAYATESPGEFFAVMSEAFFEIPELLHGTYPQVYEQLSQFYRQDPLTRYANP